MSSRRRTRLPAPRRLRLPRRYGLPAALLLLAAAVLADRLGWFGHQGSDFSRYDGQTFVVARSIDGDTFAIAAADGGSATTTVRFWGVDTPETKDPRRPEEWFGAEAAAFTQRLTDGQPVRLQLVAGKERDRYGRLLAYVYLPDDRLLNELLVEEGYAYADPRYDHPLQTRFQAAMSEARRQRRGLWAEVSPTSLPGYLQPAAR